MPCAMLKRWDQQVPVTTEWLFPLVIECSVTCSSSHSLTCEGYNLALPCSTLQRAV